MEGIELVSFQIISASGTARSCFIEAVQEAKAGNFEDADRLIKEGEEAFLEAHHAHAVLIQQEADPEQENVLVNLLLLHAEDQMMAADAFKIIAEEFIELYRRLDG